VTLPSLCDGNVIPDDANGSAQGRGGPMTDSARSGNLESSGFVLRTPGMNRVLNSRLHLSDRLRHQLVHLGAKFHFAKRNALAAISLEILRATPPSPVPSNSAAITFLGISAGRIACESQPVRHP